MVDNRRTPRQLANWAGLYRLQGESSVEGRVCEIVDISKLGLGITLDYRRLSELIGRRISVEIPVAGDTVDVRLMGHINNAAPVSGVSGIVRVGVEFVGVSPMEEAFVAAVVGVMNQAFVTN
jgi:hypothetical protein